VPPVALGMWQAGGRLWGEASYSAVREVVEAAVERGLLFFDTAELYGAGRSEELLGRALRETGVLGEAFVVTKVAGFRVTRRGVVGALEASARRLGRRPDLVLYHWPPPYPWSPCRVARLLEEAVERGLAGWMGVSNFNARELEEAAGCTRRHEVLVDQVHYSLAHRVPENRLIPAAERLGVTVMAWGPLAKGALAGRRAADNWARRLDPVFRAAARDQRLQEALAGAAERLGVPMAAVALAWLRRRGAVPVVGARRRRHVEAAAVAAELELPGEVEAELDRVSRRYRRDGCYRELHWNRFIPPPVQWLIYMAILRGV
jgi:aryl-alcohol dehydrogenase-like predicted oxidoreductase